MALPARADERYAVTGQDRFEIGASELRTTISYSGTQQLTIRKTGTKTQFTASARYTRTDESGAIPARATFVQVMTPQGELQDRSDLDPDYLTVLNQPFAVELDAQTLRDLLRLNGRVPFDFPAPMTGGSLHGYLKRGAVSRVAAKPALAVAFDAAGPMTGPLPDHAAMAINGTMRMRGTAYYAIRGDPILLGLTETLTIIGSLHDGGHTSPVTIEYRRTIRADETAPTMTEADSKP